MLHQPAGIRTLNSKLVPGLEFSLWRPGYSAQTDTLRLGTAVVLCRWACQGYSAIGYSVIGHGTDEENMDFLTSSNALSGWGINT